MIGSFDKDGLNELFGTDDSLESQLVIAIGEPLEYPILTDLDNSGSIKYYRDESNRHFVPKRSLEEILLP